MPATFGVNANGVEMITLCDDNATNRWINQHRDDCFLVMRCMRFETGACSKDLQPHVRIGWLRTRRVLLKLEDAGHIVRNSRRRRGHSGFVDYKGKFFFLAKKDARFLGERLTPLPT